MNEVSSPVDGHINRFLKYLEAEKNASPHTIKNYRGDLVEFFRFIGKNSLHGIN